MWPPTSYTHLYATDMERAALLAHRFVSNEYMFA
jgi:hypothetical protein